MKILYGLFLIILHAYDVQYFNITCPEAVSREIRSSALCLENTKYHCLYNCITTNYVEKCESPQPYRAGLYAIHCGNINAKDCKKWFYSPNVFWSHEGDKCRYQKSYCNEEGQVIAKFGNSTTDISCQCDFTNGYDYVIKPRNPCGCVPSAEDCSCYIKNCRNIVNKNFCQISREYACTPKENVRIDSDTSFPVAQAQPNCTRCNAILKVSGFSVAPKLLISACLILLIICTAILVIDLRSKSGVLSKSWNLVEEKLHDESCINYVDYFLVTKQIKEIEKVFENSNEPHLIILEGIAGSGKTQAAKYVCSKMEMKYNVIAKLDATDERTVLESLKHLAYMINLPLQSERIEETMNTETLCKTINRFLDQKYTNCPCLFLLDNVNQNFAYESLLLLKGFRGIRDFILTTKDLRIKLNHNYRLVIEFKGMDMDECTTFFQTYDKNIKFRDITELIQKTDSLPIVMNSVRQYIHVTKQSLPEYVISLKNLRSEETLKYLSKCTNDTYGKKIIESQIPSLYNIKDELQDVDEQLWQVMKFIPHLCCESIATTVLEACYFHFSNCKSKCKIDMINFLVNKCGEFSMCQIDRIKQSAFKDVTLLNRIRASREREIRCLSFHEVTKVALSSLCKETAESLPTIQLFLLKIFCYEIDIDARTDITIQRNMLFINHAKKLLIDAETTLTSLQNTEVDLFIAYLHCAIGSTLLFQRIDVESAHIHLVKARSRCFRIVGEESFLHRGTCPYIIQDSSQLQNPEINPNHIKKVAKLMIDKKIDESVVQEFIVHKRRSDHDLETIKFENIPDFQHRNCHYFTLEEYTKLSAHGSALPLRLICETFFSEFLLRTLLNNGRSLNELRYIKNDEDDHLKYACYFEFTTAKEFCKLLKEKFQDYLLFVCLETDRTGKMVMRFSHYVENDTSIDTDVEFYEDMIKNPFEFCYNFGILKMSKRTNDRHICMCYRMILRLLQLKFSQLRGQHEETYSILKKGREYANILLEKIKEMETEKINRRFKWIILPLLYLQCAKFYALSSEPEETENALRLFETTSDLEESRGVIWSRFMHEGYHGRLMCLTKMKRDSEASALIQQLKFKLPGANMTNVISNFEQLKYDRWN